GGLQNAGPFFRPLLFHPSPRETPLYEILRVVTRQTRHAVARRGNCGPFRGRVLSTTGPPPPFPPPPPKNPKKKKKKKKKKKNRQRAGPRRSGTHAPAVCSPAFSGAVFFFFLASGLPPDKRAEMPAKPGRAPPSPARGRAARLAAAAAAAAACCVRSAAGHGVGSNDGHGHGGGGGGGGGALAGQLNPPAPAPALTAATAELGFLLVGLAALFSTLGAALPFLDAAIQSERFCGGRFRDFSLARSKPFISATLGFSAGLLVALALSDLMPAGAENLKRSAVFPPAHAQLASSACFAGGLASVAACKRLAALFRRSKPDGGGGGGGTAHTSRHGHKVGEFGEHQGPSNGDESDRLNSLGYQIAISLALHNFPEGLSTFSAALLSPRIGVLYGIALSLHKIPEGLMIANARS
ncbi:MAG: hypothetical protein BJ554DRAFT_2873, partial [Olpidium bornovanus]